MFRSALVQKILRADATRKSRFHTASGTLVISPDMLRALGSTFNRVVFHTYSALPWLTYPAIHFLDSRLRGRTLFEFGSGTSTQWYAERCSEVTSVENSADWYKNIKSRLETLSNVTLRYCDTDAAFIDSISTAGKNFDAIVIDSQPADATNHSNTDEFRVACLLSALRYASEDCIFIVDNTDAHPLLSAKVNALFSGRNIRRFAGWTPGILHPNETTVVT